MIEFEFECWDFGPVDVFAETDGSNIKILSLNLIEVDFSLLCDSDQNRIKALVKEWVDHYKAMDENPSPHPADDHFGPSYVRGLNKDMGK